MMWGQQPEVEEPTLVEDMLSLNTAQEVRLHWSVPGLFFDIQAKSTPLDITALYLGRKYNSEIEENEDSAEIWVCKGPNASHRLNADAWKLVGKGPLNKRQRTFRRVALDEPLTIGEGQTQGFLVFATTNFGMGKEHTAEEPVVAENDDLVLLAGPSSSDNSKKCTALSAVRAFCGVIEYQHAYLPPK
eukprot:m.470110 g.470110  ORF g.470110 m.470110 type:complete len:188 (+) comp20367_c5_seq1:290-853(+)